MCKFGDRCKFYHLTARDRDRLELGKENSEDKILTKKTKTKANNVNQAVKANSIQVADSTETTRSRNNKDNKSTTTTVVLGDSMTKNLQSWRMKKSLKNGEKLFVKTPSRATTDDMSFYAIPSLQAKPDRIVLHTGTNDLGGEKEDGKVADKGRSFNSRVNKVSIGGMKSEDLKQYTETRCANSPCGINDILNTANNLKNIGDQLHYVVMTIKKLLPTCKV